MNEYLADVYASVFCNAEYYLDDSLVYIAREELAKRIISLQNGVLIEDKKAVVNNQCFFGFRKYDRKNGKAAPFR